MGGYRWGNCGCLPRLWLFAGHAGELGRRLDGQWPTIPPSFAEDNPDGCCGQEVRNSRFLFCASLRRTHRRHRFQLLQPQRRAAQEGADLAGIHRLAEQMALRTIAFQLLQLAKLDGVLDALGDYLQPQFAAQRQRIAQYDQAARVAIVHIGDQVAVEFHLGEGQLHQALQGGVSATEVIDGQAATQQAQAQHVLQAQRRSMQWRGFGQLEGDPLGLDVQPAQIPLDGGGKVDLGDLLGFQVEGQLQLVAALCAQRFDGLGHQLEEHAIELASAAQGGQEFSGQQDGAVFQLPAREHFESIDLGSSDIDLGLQVGAQFSPRRQA